MPVDFYEDEHGEWRWRLKGGNGEIMASGEGHRDRWAAERAWKTVEATVLIEHANGLVEALVESAEAPPA